MKKIMIIITIIMSLTSTACSQVSGIEQAQSPITMDKTNEEVIETPTEISEIPTEVALTTGPVLKDDGITNDNLEKGPKLSVMDILEPNFQNKVESALKDYIDKNAKNEFYFIPTLDYKESFIATKTIPSIDGREKINAFTYTFAVKKFIHKNIEGKGLISVVFIIEDGEFKVLDISTEDI